MRLVFRPLDGWPIRPTSNPTEPRFSATWSDTLTLLEREVDMIASKGRNAEVVLQIDAPESVMRLDGGIRSNAVVRGAGVILSFESKFGPLRYMTDQFKTASVYRHGKLHQVPGWQSNVRAIALSLEALRKVDRYGVSRRGEQYTGWKELEAGDPLSTTIAQAQAFMVEHSGMSVFDTYEDVERAFKIAAKKLHPDMLGGSTHAFNALMEHRETLLRDLP